MTTTDNITLLHGDCMEYMRTLSEHISYKTEIGFLTTLKTRIIMTLDEYQQAALETAVYPEEYRIIYPALGMTGEAGEVADKVKKVIRDYGSFTDERKREIVKEIGDVLWYCATLANDLGYTLEEVGIMNIEKLKSRKERGVIRGSGDNR